MTFDRGQYGIWELTITKHVQILPAAEWGFGWSNSDGAGYYGRHWFLHLGPLLFFLWQMTDAQYEEWCKTWFGEATE